MIPCTVRLAHDKGDGSVSKFGHHKSEKDHRNNPIPR